METKMDYEAARDLLIQEVEPVKTQRVGLEAAGGRILAQDLTAIENVPAFDRSPYDGYAFCAADTKGASKERPVTLKILEEVPAGAVPSMEVRPGTATKVLTGAPVPSGADAVIMYEKTEFDDCSVTIFEEVNAGDNITFAGEDIRKGSILAKNGTPVDAGLAGTLAAQGISAPPVYRKPVVGIISTGSELVELDSTERTASVPAGKIINTNRYTLAAALERDGCIPVYLGSAGDDPEHIAQLIRKGLGKNSPAGSGEPFTAEDDACSAGCDMILLTGGVSAGDYDLTPEAMELAGCRMLVKGVLIKPGMACCYGMHGSKPVCALSGNPASSLTNYYAVIRPVIRKMSGLADFMPKIFPVILAEAFRKKSKVPRILKGRLEISSEGKALLHIPSGQGNVMISSSIGCDCMAKVSAGSGPLEAGTVLTGFMI